MNIYAYMNFDLVKKGYSNMDEIPIEEIINSIKNYILMKQLEKDTKLDIYQLFQKYTRIGKKKDLEMIIYFLLGYISTLQSFAITWRITPDQEPIFVYNQFYPEKLDSLITSPNFNLEKVFELVLNTAIDLKEQRERRGRE